MDVTPRELREIDFRTEWKGYHRDDVDDLLERAAATIESQNERVRQLAERADSLQAQTAETAAQAAPASRETEDMLRRTLVLAQRTADEAVAEAQTEARRITEEADSHARRVVSEAEANARRVAEGERQRLEAEVLDLGARREALLADVEQLERFANDYRARLRSAIERDLDTLATRPPVVDSPRPRLHEVDIPAANSASPAAPNAAADDPRPDASTAPPIGAPTTPGAIAPAPASPAAPSAPPASAPAAAAAAGGPAPSSGAPWAPSAPASPGTNPVARPFGAPEAPAASTAPAPAPPSPAPSPPSPAPSPVAPIPPMVRDEPAGQPSSPTSPGEGDRTIELDKAPPFPSPQTTDEPLQAEVLDDDAFFASLREAVRDDSPLGPRADEPDVDLEDQDQDGRFGNVFKRRR